MADIASLIVRYGADTSAAEAGADRVQASISKAQKLVGVGLVATGAALGGFLVKSVMAAGNFESAMNGVAASLGGVDTAGGITTEQFQHLQDEALRIGATTTVGVNEAAGAMDLLAKAGVNVDDIYNGVAQAVVDTATATGESINDTAGFIGAVSNLFKDTGISASEMADVTTNALNAGQASISEFQTGITNLTPVIAGTGLSFQESAGLIAFFNAQGMAAARVGSSLTSAYMNLVNPTTAQAQAQADLGLAVYDAQGNFRGFPAILDDVRTAVEGKTQADRDQIITSLFGADALDVVNLALNSQKGALEGTIDAMGEQGTAAAASAQRMQGLKGAIENLRGAWETLTIRIGSVFLPVLTVIANAIAGLLTTLGNLPQPFIAAIAAIAGVGAVLLTAAGAWVLFGSKITQTLSLARAMLPILAGVSLPILAIAAALAALGLAYKTNFSGFADAVDALAARAKAGFEAIGAAIKILTGAKGQEAWKQFDHALVTAFGPRRAYQIDKWFRGVNRGAQEIRQQFATLRAQGLNPVAAAFATLGNTLIRLGAGQGPIAGIGRAFSAAARLAMGLGDALSDVVDAFQDLVKGDYGHITTELGEAFQTAKAAVSEFASSIWDELTRAFDAIDWGGVWDTFVSGIKGLASAGLDLGTMVVNGALELGSAILGGASDLWGWFKRQIGVGSGSNASDALNPFASQREPLTLGDVVVNAGLKLADGILGGASDLWGWFKMKLFGGGAGGLGNVPVIGGLLSSTPINVGQILIDGALELWGQLKSAADNLRGWLEPKINAGIDKLIVLSGVKVDVKDPDTSPAEKSISDKLGQIDWYTLSGNKLSFNIGEGIGKKLAEGINGISLDNLLDLSRISTSIQTKMLAVVGGLFAAGGLLSNTTNSLLGGVFKGAADGIDWGQIGSTLRTRWQDVLILLGTTLGSSPVQLGRALGDFLRQQVGTVDWAGIGSTLKTKLTEAINGIGNGLGDLSDFAFNVMGSIALAIYDKIQSAGSFGEVVVQAVREKIDGLALSAAAFPAFAKSIGESIAHAISDQVDGWSGETVKSAITTKINSLTASASDVIGFAKSIASAIWEAVKAEAANWDPRDLLPWNSRQMRDFSPDAADAKQATVGKNDFSALTGGANGALASVKALATQTASVMAQFAEAVRSGVTQATASLTSAGTAFQTTATRAVASVTQMGAGVRAGFVAMATAAQASSTQMAAQVSAQFSQMATQGTAQANSLRAGVQGAMQGMAGAAASAMSSFSSAVRSGFSQAVGAAQSGASGIQSAMAGASSGAYGYGAAVGNQFAAGLQSSLGAVASAAAALRNLMPSSPAKEGPLSKPISFQYILDDLMATMAQMPGAARGGMQGTARELSATLPLDARLGRSAGLGYSGPGGQTVIINNHYHTHHENYVTPPEMLKLINGSQKGAWAADQMSSRSREIALGTSR